MPTDYHDLATYRRWLTHAEQHWPDFLNERAQLLTGASRWGQPVERVSENILHLLCTTILGWPPPAINYQVDGADIVLTRLGIAYAIIETKRPSLLTWNPSGIASALDQACRYADHQKVRIMVISDGSWFYTTERTNGGTRDRLFCALHEAALPGCLWWMTPDGIHRDAPPAPIEWPHSRSTLTANNQPEEIFHPHYQLPARCFAYVPDANRPNTWKLPYLLADGSVDMKRLPKAIQSIVSTYRGARVSSIPEAAIPGVLQRLAQAAQRTGRYPPCPASADVYQELARVLQQVERER